MRDRLIADANRRKWIVSETRGTASPAPPSTTAGGVGLLFESADGRERRISGEISVDWLSAADPELLKLLETATPLPRRAD